VPGSEHGDVLQLLGRGAAGPMVPQPVGRPRARRPAAAAEQLERSALGRAPGSIGVADRPHDQPAGDQSA